MRRHAPGAIDRLELVQQVARLGEGRRGRRIEPAQPAGVGGPPAGELERERREIRARDFRGREGCERCLSTFGPEPIAHAGGEPAGAAAALVCGRLRDLPGDQAAHAGGRIEGRIAAQPRIDHDPDALDGEARLGDAGREHDLALPARGRAQRRILLLRAQLAVQRQDADGIRRAPRRGCLRRRRAGARAGFLERALDTAYFRRARQEAEDVAVVIRESAAYHLRGLQLERDLGAARHVTGRDLEAAPLRAHRGRAAQEPCERLEIKGRGHHQELQVLAQRLLALDAECEAEIGIETALVKLIEDDAADAAELGIRLQHACEDAFRDDLDARGPAHPRLEPGSKTHGPADRLTQELRHALRDCARRDAPRLQHQDLAPVEPRMLQQGQGNDGALAGARRRSKQYARVIRERACQRLERLADRQRR